MEVISPCTLNGSIVFFYSVICIITMTRWPPSSAIKSGKYCGGGRRWLRAPLWCGRCEHLSSINPHLSPPLSHQWHRCVERHSNRAKSKPRGRTRWTRLAALSSGLNGSGLRATQSSVAASYLIAAFAPDYSVSLFATLTGSPSLERARVHVHM